MWNATIGAEELVVISSYQMLSADKSKKVINSLPAKSCYGGEKKLVLLAKHKNTNVHTMMEPFSSSAAWFWWTSIPHPQEPTWKGLDEALVDFFIIKLLSKWEINLFRLPLCKLQQSLDRRRQW